MQSEQLTTQAAEVTPQIMQMAEQEGARHNEGEAFGRQQGAETHNPFIRAEESEEYRRMEREFREYKTKKVLSRISGLTVGNPTVSEMRAELKRAATDRAGVVVMPRLVEVARKELPQGIKVETLVNFPFALGTKKAVLREIKAAIRAKAEVGAGINLSVFASGNRRPLERELKSLKRVSGRNKATPMFSPEGLRGDQISRLAQIVKAYKFENVKLVMEGEPCSVRNTANAVKIFHDVLGEQCRVEVAGRITTAEEAEALFLAGADRIITTDYLALSRAKLDSVTV